MTSEPEAGLKTSFYLLMVYAALIGAISSLLTAGYITLYNQGIKFFEQVSLFVFSVNIWPLVLLTGAGVLIGLLINFFGQRGGLGVAQREYSQTGRLNPRNLPSILLQAFISLWSGAAVGPEGPLVFLSGGVGSFISDRLRLQKDDVQVLVYSSIAGAFGGFFGSPIVGAVGAIEYMFIRELDLYRHLIPGLLAAAVGYGVYATFLQTSFLGIYNFPDYAPPRLVDLWWALLVGVIAGGVGIVYKLIFGIVQLVFTPLEKRPVRLAIIGGVVIGLIGSFLPLTLYSGQDQLLQIIHNPAAFGIGLLLLMMLIKALLTSTSFATGFEGGPHLPVNLRWWHARTGYFQDSYIHSGRCSGDCGDGRRCMRSLSTPSDDGSLARTARRPTRPLATDCHWSCNRFPGIEGAHAPTSETQAKVGGR